MDILKELNLTIRVTKPKETTQTFAIFDWLFFFVEKVNHWCSSPSPLPLPPPPPPLRAIMHENNMRITRFPPSALQYIRWNLKNLNLKLFQEGVEACTIEMGKSYQSLHFLVGRLQLRFSPNATKKAHTKLRSLRPKLRPRIVVIGYLHLFLCYLSFHSTMAKNGSVAKKKPSSVHLDLDGLWRCHKLSYRKLRSLAISVNGSIRVILRFGYVF